MKKRYYPKPKPNYSALFTEEEHAKIQYLRNAQFRQYADNAPKMALAQLWKAYNEGGLQLSLF